MQTLRLTLATAYNLPGDGTANVVPLDLIAGGTLLSWWNPADPNYITVPTSIFNPIEGLIGFRCSIAKAEPVGGNRRWAGIYRNDQVADIAAHHHFRYTGAGPAKGPDMMSDTAPVTFNPGDRFSLLVLQDSGVPLQVVQLAINTVLWVAI